MDINFGRGYLPDERYNAWTRYEIDEDNNISTIEVILNKHTFKFMENKIISILIHELTHCSFYQLHADNFLSDEEVIFVNEFIDDYFPTLYFECD